MYFEALGKNTTFSSVTRWKTSPRRPWTPYSTAPQRKADAHYERGNGKGTLEQPFEGVLNNIGRRYRETQSDGMRKELEECMAELPCPVCGGERLSDVARAVTVGGISITAFCQMPVNEALEFMNRLTLTRRGRHR